MKRSEMKDKLGSFMFNFRHRIIKMSPQDKENTEFLKENLLILIEQAGMLPPERPDEHPLGYGGGWVSPEEEMSNYFEFKHSWEPEDD